MRQVCFRCTTSIIMHPHPKNPSPSQTVLTQDYTQAHYKNKDTTLIQYTTSYVTLPPTTPSHTCPSLCLALITHATSPSLVLLIRHITPYLPCFLVQQLIPPLFYFIIFILLYFYFVILRTRLQPYLTLHNPELLPQPSCTDPPHLQYSLLLTTTIPAVLPTANHHHTCSIPYC